jgi:hypothetical protein
LFSIPHPSVDTGKGLVALVYANGVNARSDAAFFGVVGIGKVAVGFVRFHADALLVQVLMEGSVIADYGKGLSFPFKKIYIPGEDMAMPGRFAVSQGFGGNRHRSFGQTGDTEALYIVLPPLNWTSGAGFVI